MYLSDRPVKVAQEVIRCVVLQLLETLGALSAKPQWCGKDAAEVKRWKHMLDGFISEHEAEWRKYDFVIGLLDVYGHDVNGQIEWLKQEREKYRG